MDEEQLVTLAEKLCGSPVPGVRMTEREFVDWSFDRVDAEWVDGEVILMPPVSDEHNDLDTWLTALGQEEDDDGAEHGRRIHQRGVDRDLLGGLVVSTAASLEDDDRGPAHGTDRPAVVSTR